MIEKRFQDIGGYITDTDSYCYIKVYEKTSDIIDLLNKLHEENKNLKDFAQHNYSETKKIINNLQKENEQLKQQRKELLRLIDNNIEIYENINTNVEFHQGEIQGKLTVLNSLREVILND